MMEYKVLTLPTTVRSAEKLINDYAEEGWIVICSITDYRIILGREKVEDE